MPGCHDASQSPRTAVSDVVTVTVTAKQLEKIHLVLMQLNVAAMQKHEDYSISFTKTVSIVISIKIWRTLVDASLLLAATARWFSPIAQTGKMVISLRLECMLCVHWCEIKSCRTQTEMSNQLANIRKCRKCFLSKIYPSAAGQARQVHPPTSQTNRRGSKTSEQQQRTTAEATCTGFIAEICVASVHKC